MTDTLFTRTPRIELGSEVAPAWDMLNELTGEPTFIEVFAQAPHLLDLVMNQFYAKVFFSGVVEQRYKQIARLRLSLVHGCRTCNKQNIPGAIAAGLSPAQTASMAAEQVDPALFDATELAVIEYADQMVLTNLRGALSPALFARLREHFSEAQILELGVVMAIIGGMAKLSFVVDVVEKEDYCPFTPVG